MEPYAVDLIRPWLASGETLLWAGQPQQGLRLRLIDVFCLPLAALGVALAVLLARSWALRGPAPVDIVSALLVLAIGYLGAGRFFVCAWQRRRTAYALTSHRAIIRSGIWRARVVDVDWRGVAELRLDLHRGGRGTLCFGDAFPYWAVFPGLFVPTLELYTQTRFFRIAEAERVYRLARAAMTGETAAGDD